MSLIHHRDIARAVDLALTGALDGRIADVADAAPASMYELVQLAGGDMEPSDEPLPHPWHLVVDNSSSRALGFHPEVRTVYQAM